MTPGDFIEKYRNTTLNEKKFYQSHFNDLCRLLEVPDPVTADKHGTEYCFEKNVLKLGGSSGYADVWKRNHFAWEYKGTKKNLTAAYAQVKAYADALDNPPLLIVSDSQEIRIHTNFTNTVANTITIALGDLMGPEARRLLRYCWTDPERLRPTETRATVTDKAAKAVGAIASNLRKRLGEGESRRIAHFLNRIVFCLFAEDIDLLPDRLFSDLLEDSKADPDGFVPRLRNLFRAMKDRDGFFGNHRIPWFNGGLFDDDDVIELSGLQIKDLFEAAKLDWAAIEPSIFGTLFERGLDPEKRKAMAGLFDLPDTVAEALDPGSARPAKGKGAKTDKGAKADKGVGIHYTDPDKIMKIVEPVVLRPLRAEWDAVKVAVADHRAKRDAAKTEAARTKHEQAARAAYLKFRDRLGRYRVLDPACGSGNFLYMALMHLKDLDRAIEMEARSLDLPADRERIGPDCVLGIEINPYAAELARTTVWIGELQWQMKNAGSIKRAPILGRLDGIENRDALLNPDGSEAQWPKADAIVGNPPFLGDKLMISALGESYVASLRSCYEDTVTGRSDIVCYWFAKCGKLLRNRNTQHVGLVATNSIRGGRNRWVIDSIVGSGSTIFEAWSDEPWVLNGAAVRVSLICFFVDISIQPILNGKPSSRIHPDLSAESVDLTKAETLSENKNICFIGRQKDSLDVPGAIARKWLQNSGNPNGRPNSDVVRPWLNGISLLRHADDRFMIDFRKMNENDACLYEEPFEYLRKHIKPLRMQNRDRQRRELWWRPGRSGEEMYEAILALDRYVATVRHSKHRIFVWLSSLTIPDSALVLIAKQDDFSFGVLSSHFHEIWTLRMCTWLGVGNDPRYTPTTCFETFPFPEGLTPDIPAEAYADDPRAIAIAAAAKELNEKREAWLNPPDLTRIEPEVVPGYPDRILPRNDKAAAELKKRTLTNLYNQRPAWLDMLHKRLDAAVAAAYGWPAEIPDEEALARLFALNQERAAAQAKKGKPEE